MKQNLDMSRQSIPDVSQLSTLTLVYTPTLRATSIEFSDVANSGATDLIIKSGSAKFMAFKDTDGINIYLFFNEI